MIKYKKKIHDLGLQIRKGLTLDSKIIIHQRKM